MNAMVRKVDSLAQRLRFAAGARIDRARAALDLKEALIKASDPRKILSMGYALVTGRDGKVLKSVAPVAAGDRIGVRFADGTISAVVHEVKQMPGQAGHDDSLRHSRLDRESND